MNTGQFQSKRDEVDHWTRIPTGAQAAGIGWWTVSTASIPCHFHTTPWTMDAFRALRMIA